MQFDLSTQLVDLAGEVIKKDDKPVTIKTVIVDALVANVEGDDGSKKYEKYKLATAINDNKEDLHDLAAEEIVKIKEVVGKFFTTMVVGQVYDLLK